MSSKRAPSDRNSNTSRNTKRNKEDQSFHTNAYMPFVHTEDKLTVTILGKPQSYKRTGGNNRYDQQKGLKKQFVKALFSVYRDCTVLIQNLLVQMTLKWEQLLCLPKEMAKSPMMLTTYPNVCLIAFKFHTIKLQFTKMTIKLWSLWWQRNIGRLLWLHSRWFTPLVVMVAIAAAQLITKTSLI